MLIYEIIIDILDYDPIQIIFTNDVNYTLAIVLYLLQILRYKETGMLTITAKIALIVTNLYKRYIF